MKIKVRVKPNAKEEWIIKSNSLFQKFGESNFIVAVKQPPTHGRANAAVVKVLAKYFGLVPSRVRIVSGNTSRNKIIEVNLS